MQLLVGEMVEVEALGTRDKGVLQEKDNSTCDPRIALRHLDAALWCQTRARVES
jgi:hypothetical protein